MSKTVAVILFTCLCITSSVRAECESGWMPYKDQSCIKAFDDFLTYDEAKYFCESQENADSAATLVMVKDAEMQELLAGYTEDKFENFWVGAKYDEASSQFKWEDGDPLTYTNWAEGFPRNNTDVNSCIQFVPVNAKTAVRLDGKWQNAACQRRNLAMCQRALPWTFEEATRAIRKLQKEQAEATKDIQKLQGELETVGSRFFPIGFIYIEYSNQSSPVNLWPGFTWDDVTKSYAGLFFRALGGGSESWGNTQDNCSPLITQMDYSRTVNGSAHPRPLTLSSEGWSGWGYSGLHYYSSGDSQYYDRLRFNVKNCEVRPNNQAVRIWKRSA